MNARPLPTLLIVAALLLIVVGCGEKDEPAATGATTTTTAETTTSTTAGRLNVGDYAIAADGLCSAAMARQERLRRRQGGRQITLRDRARLLVLLAPPRVRLGEELGELEPPRSERAQAKKLVASAVRRGEASTEAGRLFEAGGSREKIAAAAAAEHDERELFVEIASGMGMTECAEVLPPSEVAAVKAAVAQGLAGRTPEQRCAVFGERYIAELYERGIEECVEDPDRAAAATVTVADIEGMEDVFAQAVADVSSGGEETQLRVRLTYEGGGYKIDKLD